MTDFDYKNYSLSKLEEWVHDAISASEATPQEVYDTILKVVREQYYYYKDGTSKTYELLSLLNGHGKDFISFNTDLKGREVFDNMNSQYPYDICDLGNTSDYCNNSWNSFWEEDVIKEDKVVKWQLPVEVDGPSGEYFVSFPDDLLEAANLKEGDEVEWVDNKNSSWTLKKVENRT